MERIGGSEVLKIDMLVNKVWSKTEGLEMRSARLLATQFFSLVWTFLKTSWYLKANLI